MPLLIEACKVEPPCELMTCEGFAPVLNSNAEVQSAASASFGMWEISYKLPGRPCFRTYAAPTDLVEVRPGVRP